MAQVTVTVKLNSHKLSIDNMRPKAYTKRGDEIIWHCSDARMEVDFTKSLAGSPFPWTIMSIAKNTSTPHRALNPVRIAAYKLTIFHPDYTVVIDPEVDADGGDPDDRKRKPSKKAAKKAAKKATKKSAKRKK